MPYEGNGNRPPSAADRILRQVTVGCTHNACAFCGAYMGERFRLKDMDTVFADIAFAARHMRRQRRVFLCDGDVATLPLRTLAPILERIRRDLPWVTRVGAYANARGLRAKSAQDLAALRDMGLGMLYMGLESGDDAVLAAMNKGVDVETILREAAKVKAAGIKLSVTVLAGLGGEQGWRSHAELTGKALTRMDPDHAAALTLIPVPGTPLWSRVQAGEFRLPQGPDMVRELRLMLEHTHMTRGLFLANHASNHVPLKLRMPRDRQAALDLLDAALEGRAPLKPEVLRRL